MDNRRNFYRILRVQPDASPEVIRQSYRSLMQTLKMHPDLGGEHWDAGIVNQAYSTLRDLGRRALYDAELLSRYHIKTLGAGGVSSENFDTETVDSEGNQRNYYRLLHVQPDAEIEVICASYKILYQRADAQGRITLDEAFAILQDVQLRACYDEMQQIYPHAVCVDKLRQRQVLASVVHGESEQASCKNPVNNQDVSHGVTGYVPTIHYFCPFCKTPYLPGANAHSDNFCDECNSPLSRPQTGFINMPRRGLTRMQQSISAQYYSFWPEKGTLVVLADLSPTGVSFTSNEPLENGQLIKLDAPHFKAIAEVVHCRQQTTGSIIGARFSTIGFVREAGSFLSTSV